MHERFRKMVEALHPSCEKLLGMAPVLAAEVPGGTPCGGVYLFSEGVVHLYAGRTKRQLAKRIRHHFGPASDCPFAWLLAREATGDKTWSTPYQLREQARVERNLSLHLIRRASP
jgi:hypothetical protein